MLFELIIAFFLGILAGTFAGLLPGIHINLISVLLISSLPALSKFQFISPISLVIFIVSMAISQTFIDFIPSIYLGAPEEDSFLSVLPGHEFLQKGKGHEAVLLTLLGSISAIPLILILTPVFIYLLPILFNFIRNVIPFILIFASLYLIFREDNFLLSLTVFLLAGFLGYATLNLPIKEPLFPLLTGLFGTSALVISLKSKLFLPKQKITSIKNIQLTKKQYLKAIYASAISAPLCSFLPGIGSGHAALLGSEIKEQNRSGFLLMLGLINTIVMSLSFIALYSINKSRTGAAAALKEILQTLSPFHIIIILITIILSALLSFILGIYLSKLSTIYINKINYKYLTISVMIFLLLLTMLLSNFLGLLVLITGTALGVFTILSNSRRINLMGCLLIPTIIFYLLL